MYSRVLKSVSLFIALACVVLTPIALGAQEIAKPATKASAGDTPSKWDLFAGYSFMAPNSTVDGSAAGPHFTPQASGTENGTFKTEKIGTAESVARFFNNNFGVEIDSGQHDVAAPSSDSSSNSGLFSLQAGLIYRWPGDTKVTPWVHAMAGGVILDGPVHQAWTPGMTITGGGGLDYGLNKHWSIRMIEADYEYAHVAYGAGHESPSYGWQPGGTANINGIRLSAGIVYHIGSIPPPTPITLAVAVTPVSVFPGEPVSATATAGNLDPKLNVVYAWSGNGLTGSGTSASIATAALAPGTYTVQAQVKEGKPGKEGFRPWQVADASASFTVKQFEPPTISCLVTPSNIKPGESATITSVAVSPQNRPLTYSYSASAGTVTGSGTTATYNSAGAPTGAVGITCNVADDKGGNATANTIVTITAPYVAPVPHTQALCSVAFEKDKLRPARVDNEAKACLDEIALDLQKQPDAKAVVVGEATTLEKTPKEGRKHAKVADLAAERAVNAKQYLVTEKGIDATRVSVATGSKDGKTVEDYLVPPGADFTADVTGTSPVNETVVKPQVRKPLGARPAHHKKPVKAAASTAMTPR